MESQTLVGDYLSLSLSFNTLFTPSTRLLPLFVTPLHRSQGIDLALDGRDEFAKLLGIWCPRM